MKTEHQQCPCHEVQIHYKRPLFETLKKIASSEDADAILREFIDPNRIDHKEFFWLILLDNSNYVIGLSEIGIGNTTGVCVNFKEIFQLAILCNASGIIVAHNHPSGKLAVSNSDIQVTQKLKKSAKLLDISLLDHLIITSEGFLSLSDGGIL
jgi:DNA repair protein RadC